MHIVLIKPEIPQNTGSIARTCAATRTPLHLIGPLGFEISEKRVRRAGLDYWPFVHLIQHDSWLSYQQRYPDRKVWAFTKFAQRTYADVEYSPNDSLVFGSETKGLGEEFLRSIPSECQVRLPMVEAGVRSLNLSNAVSIGLYEALRQTGWDGSE
jgi:tRNA (cytidine/uridine-2'-O-)-methyltransferase